MYQARVPDQCALVGYSFNFPLILIFSHFTEIDLLHKESLIIAKEQTFYF